MALTAKQAFKNFQKGAIHWKNAVTEVSAREGEVSA